MPTVQERYTAATSYVRRAIADVADRGVLFALDPITGFIEWYAGRAKVEEPQHELERIEARWLRATTDDARATIAHEAELLADRIEENLPGAPQDRPRTNLYADEIQRSTAATGYQQEFDRQATDVWNGLATRAKESGHAASGIGKWLLAGGAAVLGWKAFRYVQERERLREPTADRQRRLLDANLERAAEQRGALEREAPP